MNGTRMRNWEFVRGSNVDRDKKGSLEPGIDKTTVCLRISLSGEVRIS